MDLCKRYFLVSLVVAFLAGCAASDNQPQTRKSGLSDALNHSLFQLVAVPEAEALFQLSGEEQARFLAYVERLRGYGERDDRIVYHYLENKLNNFNYHGDTLTAQQSLDEKHGNCISLAILTQAYAELIGVETGFQEMRTDPVYSKQDNLILVSSHYRTKLYAPEHDDEDNDNMVYLIRAATLVDYFPSSNSFFTSVSANKSDLIAKYYGNLAAEALVKEDLNKAYSLLLAALKYTPEKTELYNLAGVLHRRGEDIAGAERIYRLAIANGKANTPLYENYRVLARQMNNQDLVAELGLKIDLMPKDPFMLIFRAKEASEHGAHYTAKELLKKAIVMAPYLPEPHVELAKILYVQGYNESSITQLENALEKTHDAEKLTLYQAKYQALLNKTQH